MAGSEAPSQEEGPPEATQGLIDEQRYEEGNRLLDATNRLLDAIKCRSSERLETTDDIHAGDIAPSAAGSGAAVPGCLGQVGDRGASSSFSGTRNCGIQTEADALLQFYYSELCAGFFGGANRYLSLIHI